MVAPRLGSRYAHGRSNVRFTPTCRHHQRACRYADFVAKVGCGGWMLVGRFTNGDRLCPPAPGALYATLTLRNTRRMSGWRSRTQRPSRRRFWTMAARINSSWANRSRLALVPRLDRSLLRRSDRVPSNAVASRASRAALMSMTFWNGRPSCPLFLDSSLGRLSTPVLKRSSNERLRRSRCRMIVAWWVTQSLDKKEAARSGLFQPFILDCVNRARE